MSVLRKLHIIILISISLSVFADNQTDSLKALLGRNNFKDAQSKVETLMELSKAQFYPENEAAFNNAMNALKLAHKTGDKPLEAKAAKNVGLLFYRQSDFAKALEYFNIALDCNIEAENIDELAASYNNVGVVFNRLGYYNIALQNHIQQLKINEETGNLYGIANSNLNIGNIYNNMGENEKAYNYYQESLKISEELNDTNFMATSYLNLGVASMELLKYDQAIRYFNKALPIKKRLGDRVNEASIYLNMGVIYNTRENYPLAEDYFQQGFEIFSDLNMRQNVVKALINLGDNYLKINNPRKSLEMITRAHEIAREIDSKQLLSETCGSLAQWYESQGRYQESLEYFKQMTALNDTLFDLEKSKQIRNLQIVYEVEKKEREIMEQDLSIQRLKASQFYLLLAIIIALSMAFVVYYRYRTKKKLNRELETKIAEALRKEKEQQQIIVHQSSLTSLGELASGIAHEIKQPLQNISLVNEGLQMEIMEEQVDRDFVANSAKDIAEGIKRIKFIINEISNFSRGQQLEILEWFNVNTRIENAFSLARTRFSNRRIDVKFELDDSIPDIQGNPYKFEQVVVNFFNNAKDAIEEKAEKTDQAFEKTMIVRSYLKEGHIHVEVQDNGMGVPDSIKTRIFLPFFTTKEIGKGTGLGLSISLGIAKEMGGIIEIESEEGKGTLMRLKIPAQSKQTEQ
jgi:signal transduction histidine kinase